MEGGFKIVRENPWNFAVNLIWFKTMCITIKTTEVQDIALVLIAQIIIIQFSQIKTSNMFNKNIYLIMRTQN